MRKPLTLVAVLALVVGATLVTASDAQARWRNRRGCCQDSCYSSCGYSTCNTGCQSRVSNCCYTVVTSCCGNGRTMTTTDQHMQTPKEAPPAPQNTPNPSPEPQSPPSNPMPPAPSETTTPPT